MDIILDFNEGSYMDIILDFNELSQTTNTILRFKIVGTN